MVVIIVMILNSFIETVSEFYVIFRAFLGLENPSSSHYILIIIKNRPFLKCSHNMCLFLSKNVLHGIITIILLVYVMFYFNRKTIYVCTQNIFQLYLGILKFFNCL